MTATIDVELAYAGRDDQVLLKLSVPAGSTVEDVIRRSGVLQRFAEIDLATAAVGVFAERVALDRPVEQGDRVEIYRPLLIDPKEARRRRAELAKGKKRS